MCVSSNYEGCEINNIISNFSKAIVPVLQKSAEVRKLRKVSNHLYELLTDKYGWITYNVITDTVFLHHTGDVLYAGLNWLGAKGFIGKDWIVSYNQ